MFQLFNHGGRFLGVFKDLFVLFLPHFTGFHVTVRGEERLTLRLKTVE